MAKTFNLTFATSAKLSITTEEKCGVVESSNLSKVFTKKETEILERLILAHACAGVDVSSSAYLEGLDSLADGLSND